MAKFMSFKCNYHIQDLVTDSGCDMYEMYSLQLKKEKRLLFISENLNMSEMLKTMHFLKKTLPVNMSKILYIYILYIIYIIYIMYI